MEWLDITTDAGKYILLAILFLIVSNHKNKFLFYFYILMYSSGIQTSQDELKVIDI
jgi:hypothetical protein